MKKPIIITAIVAAIVLFSGIGLYNYANNLQQNAVDQETALNAQYLANQNELSTYISKFYESVGIANLKSDKMDAILTDAVKGRYEGHTSAQPGQGQLFSAITEAYPHIDMSQYDKILDIINAGRDAYKNKQDKLTDMLRSFDKWRKSGILQSHFLKGYPDESLEARIGTNKKTGKDAEDQMWLIVTTASTKESYQSGNMEPLTVPGANGANGSTGPQGPTGLHSPIGTK